VSEKNPEIKDRPGEIEKRPRERPISEKTARDLGRTAIKGGKK